MPRLSNWCYYQSVLAACCYTAELFLPLTCTCLTPDKHRSIDMHTDRMIYDVLQFMLTKLGSMENSDSYTIKISNKFLYMLFFFIQFI